MANIHVLVITIIDIMMSKLCKGIILQHSFMKQSKCCCEDIVATIFVENYNTRWMRPSRVVIASGCQCQSRYTVLGSIIPASSDTMESEGRQMKQC
jgi:hypothetical protein